MIGKAIVAGLIIMFLFYFSLAKSAGYADQRLEEIQDALFRKEECNIENTSQEKR